MITHLNGVVTVKMHRGNAFAKIEAQGALEAYKWLESAGLAGDES